MLTSTYNYQPNHVNVVRQQAIAAAPTPPIFERRISPRVSVSLEAVWEALSGNREARVSDISLHGCFLEACGQTSVGEKIEFLLKTPTQRWLYLKGVVAFYQPMLGFGLKFTDISAEDQAMIKQLVEFYS
jgi:hypothetical protein